MSIYGDYNSDNVEVTEFSKLPAGKYKAFISGEETKISKAGNEYICLTYDIVEGEHTGRTVYDNISLHHPTPKTAKIAEETIKKICLATGKDINAKNETLRGGVLTIHVRPQKNDKKYNEIHKYESADSSGAAAVDSDIPF